MIISASSPITPSTHRSNWRNHTSTPSPSSEASSVWSNLVLYPPLGPVSFSQLREDGTHPQKCPSGILPLPQKHPSGVPLPSKSAPQVFPPPPGRRENRSKSPYILYIIRCKYQKSRSEKGMFPTDKVGKVVVFLPQLSVCRFTHFCPSTFLKMSLQFVPPPVPPLPKIDHFEHKKGSRKAPRITQNNPKNTPKIIPGL